ncbi:MAG TPA: dockerin type I domain-containing protein, partial [Pirellulaceae bacterium]|nr:dockerin type I domain-containing protein [Pirellulaceae bacterium]
PNVSSPGVEDLHTFNDGDLDELRETESAVRSLDPNITFDEPFLNQWWRMARDTDRLVRTNWDATGEVHFVTVGGDAQLSLTQTADTSLGQFVSLAPDASAVQFSLAVDAAGPDDALEVRLDDALLGRVDLSGLSGESTRSMTLAGYAGREGRVTFRLVGPQTNAAQIRLDDFAIASPLALQSLRSTSSVEESTSLTLQARGADDAQRVAFYRESNGVEGLQLGAGGDAFAAEDSQASDGWRTTVDLSKLPRGTNKIYATAFNSTGQNGPVVSNTIYVETGASPGWKNTANALDVDNDGSIAAIDVLPIINDLNSQGARLLPNPRTDGISHYFPDTDGDGYLAPIDALLVINHLNRAASGGEAESSTPLARSNVDGVLGDEELAWLLPTITELRRELVGRPLDRSQVRQFNGVSLKPPASSN